MQLFSVLIGTRYELKNLLFVSIALRGAYLLKQYLLALWFGAVVWRCGLALWCSGYHYCTTSFNKAWTQVLRRFKPCSQRFGHSRWWGSLPVVRLEIRLNAFRWSTAPQKQFIFIKVTNCIVFVNNIFSISYLLCVKVVYQLWSVNIFYFTLIWLSEKFS